MPDQITVQFGGREAVLRKVASHCWYHRELVISCRDDNFFTGMKWEATPKRLGEEWREFQAFGDTPQAAVDSVESKLRALRDELNLVLGDNQSKGNQ